MKLFEMVRKNLAAAKTRAALEHLSDRQLADIGIARSEIGSLTW